MTSHVRPLFLGYIRADVLKDRADLPSVEAKLKAFAHREAFSLDVQLVLSGPTEGARTAIFTANSTPRSGGPGVGPPEPRRARRCTSRAVC